MTVNTCDLYDHYGDKARVIGAPFHDFGGRVAFAGEAVTVKCFEDNSRLKALAREPGRGKVLVVDGGGSLRAALMGDMIAEAAAEAGWEGAIIFGCIRNTDEFAASVVDAVRRMAS
jgi:regulator of ribonuclease activity A